MFNVIICMYIVLWVQLNKLVFLRLCSARKSWTNVYKFIKSNKVPLHVGMKLAFRPPSPKVCQTAVVDYRVTKNRILVARIFFYIIFLYNKKTCNWSLTKFCRWLGESHFIIHKIPIRPSKGFIVSIDFMNHCRP